MPDAKPLVLDVDGTFLKTDLLLENFWAGLGRDPLATLSASFAHFRRPARLKAALAEIAPLRIDLMPVNPDIKALAARFSRSRCLWATLLKIASSKCCLKPMKSLALI